MASKTPCARRPVLSEGEPRGHDADVCYSSAPKLVDAGDKGVVFLLWGDKAHKLAGLINEAKHKVIKTSHPSPLGYTKTAAPFARSGCFKAANDFLEEIGRGPVDWRL